VRDHKLFDRGAFPVSPDLHIQVSEGAHGTHGFTDEELNFIINYDIKYLMGRDGGGGEEEQE
jgi:hypothetical protein